MSECVGVVHKKWSCVDAGDSAQGQQHGVTTATRQLEVLHHQNGAQTQEDRRRHVTIETKHEWVGSIAECGFRHDIVPSKDRHGGHRRYVSQYDCPRAVLHLAASTRS